MSRYAAANAPSGPSVDDVFDEIEDTDYGATRTALAERAVTLADELGDEDLQVRARMAVVESGSFGGAPEKALTAFTWVLARADEEPERYGDWSTLLWRYKWVADALRRFPHIEAGRIDRILDDMTERYRRAGASLRPVYGLRASWAASRGERAEVERWRAEWRGAARDSYADCDACERGRDIEHDVDAGDYAAAFRRARPMLEGRARCTEQPHVTLPRLLLPLVRRGRCDEADALRERLLRLVRRNPEFFTTAGRHIEYLAVVGRYSAALGQLEQWLPQSLRTYDLGARFSYLRGTLVLVEALQRQGRRDLGLRLPATARPPVEASDGRYDLGALHGWAEAEARDLAGRFDARNGTSHFREVLDGRSELHDLAAGLPGTRRAAS